MRRDAAVEWLAEGQLVELLDGLRVIAVGKIVPLSEALARCGPGRLAVRGRRQID